MKKFPTNKVILNILLAMLFGGISHFVMIFVTNTRTAMVLQGLKSGNNSIVEYTEKMPQTISLIFFIIALFFIIKTIFIILSFFRKRNIDNEEIIF